VAVPFLHCNPCCSATKSLSEGGLSNRLGSGGIYGSTLGPPDFTPSASAILTRSATDFAPIFFMR
jgi:hypothetical protein